MKSQTHTPGSKDMKGPGASIKEMRELRNQEALLRNRLQKLQERRLALRRRIINELD